MNSEIVPGALQSYVDKWLAVQPQQRIALAFVDPRKYPGHIALAALEQELLAAAYGIREPQVAATKLNWWAEELAGAPTSGGRHPLTQLLFDDDERAHAIAGELWLAPAVAALAQLEAGTASDFAAQLDAATALHGALARLETAWWYGAQANAERATQVATLGHLLHALLHLEQDAERDRLSLPMAQLARHGLSRAQLRVASPARQAAVQGQLADLLLAWRAAARLPGPLSVFRGLESRHGLLATVRAAGAADSLQALAREQASTGLRTTLQAWQAARAWRRAGN